MMYGANPCENWESTPLGKCKIGTNIDQNVNVLISKGLIMQTMILYMICYFKRSYVFVMKSLWKHGEVRIKASRCHNYVDFC